MSNVIRELRKFMNEIGASPSDILGGKIYSPPRHRDDVAREIWDLADEIEAKDMSQATLLSDFANAYRLKRTREAQNLFRQIADKYKKMFPKEILDEFK